ncbi:MAG: metal-dependent hydrolase [Amphritea sp.]
MDPISQGVLGACLPQAASERKNLAVAGWIGALAGMAPDLDVFIRSNNDPLLFLEYHRQFTHSLIFIPVGALMCSVVLHWILGRRYGLSFKLSFWFCLLGYATHALLDACTTYGTYLYWPFSDSRIAWNNVFPVDPAFTVPILLLVLLAAWKKNPWIARLALFWAVSYLLFGAVQRDRAEGLGWQMAADQGRLPVSLSAKPSFANLLVWKIITETDDRYFVDAVRVGLETEYFPGQSVLKFKIERDLPWLDPSSQQAKDLERFRLASRGYIALDPVRTNRVIDIRYSMLPNQIKPIWSIQLSPSAKADQHVEYFTEREGSREAISVLWAMLIGSPSLTAIKQSL